MVKQLSGVRDERDDLAAAERVLARMGEQIRRRAGRDGTGRRTGRRGRGALVPRRAPEITDSTPLQECQRILAWCIDAAK